MCDQDDLTPEQLQAMAAEAENNESQCKVNYKAPAQKSLQEIQELDKDDESLRKYKETLLGNNDVVQDENTPNIQVLEMKLLCDSAPKPLTLDLRGDLSKLKNSPLVLKEGVEYKIRIKFKVNKEIVSGLKYTHQTFRKGFKVDKDEFMVGSYGPRAKDPYEYTTVAEEAPKGMVARGCYTFKSRFTDDDNHDHLSWEWCLSIKKDWE